MKNVFTHIRSMLLPLVLLVAGGCAHDDISMPEGEDNENNRVVVLRIALPTIEGSTRSNPMGGEEGNGREEGVLNEDKIHDINIFFYQAEEGLDASDDTPILYCLYYNLDDQDDPNNSPLEDIEALISNDVSLIGSKVYEISFTVSENSVGKEIYDGLTNKLNFAATANAGFLGGVDETTEKSVISTMGDLRGIDFAKDYSSHRWNDYKVNATKADAMDYFLMSTAYNKEYFYEGVKSTGTNMLSYKNDKYIGTTTLERLYARIDLWYNATDNAGIESDATANADIDKLTYLVKDENIDTKNKVYILNVLPVNVMQQPSYLFKKVTAKSPANPISGWTKDFLRNVDVFNWGGKETPDKAPTASPNDLPTNYVMERHTLDKNPEVTTNDYSAWYGSTRKLDIIENIKNSKFGPISGYYNMERETGSYDPDYKCDRVSIISYANENTQPTDCFSSDYLTGLAMRALYIPEKIYKEYTTDDNGVKSLVEMIPDERAGFTTGRGNIYRYSPTKDGKVLESETLYFSSELARSAYAKDHPEDNAIMTSFDSEIYTHTDGNKELGIKCYYNLWLRHYNDENADPQLSYPMEYAIVRNNIYRVALSFSGPGDPTPTMREPDTMQARIFVRKWNQRVENTPLEF